MRRETATMLGIKNDCIEEESKKETEIENMEVATPSPKEIASIKDEEPEFPC